MIYRQCFNFLNNIVSTFFKFALALSLFQVPSSYSHKHKKWLRRIKVPPKNNCVKPVAQSRVIAQTWLSFSNTELSFWFPMKASKSQLIVWLSVWKSWSLVSKWKAYILADIHLAKTWNSELESWASYLYFLLWNLSFSLILPSLSPFLFF